MTSQQEDSPAPKSPAEVSAQAVAQAALQVVPQVVSQVVPQAAPQAAPQASAQATPTGRPKRKQPGSASSAAAPPAKKLTLLPHSDDKRVDEARATVLDRYHTIVRASKFKALYDAVAAVVTDSETKANIQNAATHLMALEMTNKISNDKNEAFMKEYYFKNLSSLPKFDFKPPGANCKDLIDFVTQKHQHTNEPRTNHLTNPPPENSESTALNGWNERNLKDTEGTVTKQKWEYVILALNNTHMSRSYTNTRDAATQLPGSFVNREQANARLDELTRYDQFDGGMAAVSRRHAYEHTPSKLLKVELTLATGEQRVLWVERRLVNLDTLTKRERSLKKWSNKRPKLPHYIVECEFMTRKIAEVPMSMYPASEQVADDSDDDDGDTDSDSDTDADYDNSDNRNSNKHEKTKKTNTSTSTNTNTNNTTTTPSNLTPPTPTTDIELTRLPLTTFTDRGLANEHAGALFLRHTAVREAIRGPLDDFWWVNNAVAAHREADKLVAVAEKEKKKEGNGKGDREWGEEEEGNDRPLYVAELYTMDMNTRLGYDWVRVAVHAVEDVVGPLNI